MNATLTSQTPAPTASPRRELELPALVPITWAVAGGMLLGGAAVALLVMASRLSGHALIAASAAFYVIGALLGLTHGAALALFGRPEGLSKRQALGQMSHGLIWLVPVLLVGWLAAGWVAALPLVIIGRHYVAGAVTLAAWAMLVLVVWSAISTGYEAAKHAFRRWPDRVAGTLLVGAAFLALAVNFAIERPTVWGLGIRLTGFGAVLFLLALTFWVYGPIITVGLALLRRIAPTLPVTRVRTANRARGIAAKLGVAIGVGVVVALLALPFHKGVLGLPTDVERFGAWSAALLAVSHALTDELAMRLFLFTAAFVIASRLLPVRNGKGAQWPVLVAVGVAALGDLLFHLPAVAALGLPGMGVALSYIVARLAIPAVLFGYVFWRRGLGAAVTAHAAADVVLGLLLL